MNKTMQSKAVRALLAAALMAPLTCINAADQPKPAKNSVEKVIDKPQADSRGRLRLRGKASFLMRGSFRRLGNFPTQTATLGAGAVPGVAAGTVLGPGATTLTPGNRFYDDGFVAMDSAGFADGNTWNWGNANASQIPAGGASVNMNSSTAIADASVNGVDSDISPGAELSYLYKVSDISNGSWGILAGIGYSFVNIEDTSVALGTELRRTDNYAAGAGTVLAGTRTGDATTFGPRISQTPASVTITPIANGSAVGGLREIQANIFDFQLGPYVDFDLGKGATLSLSAGGLGAFVDSEFSVNESTTITAITGTQPWASGTQTTTASSSETGFVFGGFAGLELGVQISPRTSIFAGAEYRYMGDFDQTLGARQATLHLDRAVSANLGLSFSF